MSLQRGINNRRRAPFTAPSSKSIGTLHFDRRLQFRLPSVPLLLPGASHIVGLRAGQRRILPAASSMHAGHYVSPVSTSYPLKQTAPGMSRHAPPTVTPASRGGDAGFVSATKLQQQQYVRRVQQQRNDLPGSSQSSQQQQPVEARHRGDKATQSNSQEPVFSYQQLFSQDVSSAATKQQQQQPKGFGKSKSRKAGSGTSASAPAGPAAPQEGTAAPGTAMVRFCITHQVEYGQNMRMTGSTALLGAWDSNNGPKLKWSEGHKWSADVALPPGGYEFKFLMEHRSGFLEWENGSNRSFTVPKTAAQMQVAGHWGSTEGTEVLELQQQATYRQQIQKLQVQEEQLEAAQRELEATARAEEAAFAAANKAAAAAYKQQAEAAAAAEAPTATVSPSPTAAPAARAPADMFTFDLGLLDSNIPGHQQLMQVLQGFRQDMIDGLSGVTSTMQEIQEDLSQVQQQMSRLSAERVLEQQGLAVPGDVAAGAALEPGAAPGGSSQGPGGLTAATAAIIAADAAVAQEQALSGLHGVVQTWQQELVNFKEDSQDLRHELEQLRISLEAQMADNTAAVQDLELLVKQLMGMDVTNMPRPSRVVAAAAVAPAPPVEAPPAGPSSDGSGPSSGLPQSSELLDPEDKMLLDRINHLASDLSAEMKEAVQELELQQQSLLERHQHIIADLSISANNGNTNSKNRMLDLGYGAGLGMRMQPTNTATSIGGRNSPSSRQQAAEHVTRAIAHWLDSHQVQQYHQGLLLAVMTSSGLWQDSMWEQMEAGALRATYKAYKSVWSEACLQTWKDNITTKQALLTALSSGRQQLLSMHILWSLQELSTHSTQLQQLLTEVATPIELGLLQKLRQKGGAGQGWALGVTGAPVGGGEAAAAAQCAVLLQRWLGAADGGGW